MVVQNEQTHESLEVSPGKLCAALIEMHRQKEEHLKARVSELEGMLASEVARVKSQIAQLRSFHRPRGPSLDRIRSGGAFDRRTDPADRRTDLDASAGRLVEVARRAAAGSPHYPPAPHYPHLRSRIPNLETQTLPLQTLPLRPPCLGFRVN